MSTSSTAIPWAAQGLPVQLLERRRIKPASGTPCLQLQFQVSGFSIYRERQLQLPFLVWALGARLGSATQATRETSTFYSMMLTESAIRVGSLTPLVA